MISFKNIRKLNLPIGQYVVFGSACLELASIREASDVEIVVTDDVWKDLTKRYPAVKNEVTHKFTIRIDDIEIYKSLDPYEGSLQEIIDNSEVVQGVAFASLEDVRKIKKSFGKEKDLEDVKLIDEYLGEEN